MEPLSLGTIFWWDPYYGRGPREHPYFLISRPFNKGVRVVTNFTDPSGGEKAIVVKMQTHPILTKDSEINFGDTVVLPVA